MACAPSEDSDQTGHAPSLSARMPRLIGVFVGCSHFAGFVMRLLIYHIYVTPHQSLHCSLSSYMEPEVALDKKSHL